MPVKYQVERFKKTVIEREHGYMPIKAIHHFQQLVCYSPGMFGMVYRKVVDCERIPDHVIISLGCFGDTGGWRSKFAYYIDPDQRT